MSSVATAVSHAEDGLQHRNFTCDKCRQRWEEGPENGPVQQDGLLICLKKCYEKNGGTIERAMQRAAAANMGAVEGARQQRAPMYPTRIDGVAALSWISAFSVRPLVIRSSVVYSSPNLVLTGGFRPSDAITFDSGVTATVTLTADTATLTVNGSSQGSFTLYLNGEPYRYSIEVHP
jgi:hypothetical protein